VIAVETRVTAKNEDVTIRGAVPSTYASPTNRVSAGLAVAASPRLSGMAMRHTYLEAALIEFCKVSVPCLPLMAE